MKITHVSYYISITESSGKQINMTLSKLLQYVMDYFMWKILIGKICTRSENRKQNFMWMSCRDLTKLPALFDNIRIGWICIKSCISIIANSVRHFQGYPLPIDPYYFQPSGDFLCELLLDLSQEKWILYSNFAVQVMATFGVWIYQSWQMTWDLKSAWEKKAI